MKYYFDTSSLVKIYHSEQGSKEALELYQGDREICISELGVLEFVSAVYRKYRESEIDSNTLDELILKFQEDVENRYELLSFSPLVFEEASRLLEIHGKWHSLRTLDSLQFAFFQRIVRRRMCLFAQVKGWHLWLSLKEILSICPRGIQSIRWMELSDTVANGVKIQWQMGSNLSS